MHPLIENVQQKHHSHISKKNTNEVTGKKSKTAHAITKY